MSRKEQLQKIANLYFKGRDGNATAKQIAAWALEEGHWKPEHSSLIKQCAHELASAMAEEYFNDPQGRRVRAKHAARIVKDEVQATLWDDIRMATRDHMEMSVKQRRHQIVGELAQIKTDVDSFNQNSCSHDPIQFVLDMSYDVAEIEIWKKREPSSMAVTPSPNRRPRPSIQPQPVS